MCTQLLDRPPRPSADLGIQRVFPVTLEFLVLSSLLDGAPWMPETPLSLSPPPLFTGQLVGAVFVLQPAS